MMDLEYYEISVPDRNDSIMRVNLDEVYYNLRLTWNAYGGFWMLSMQLNRVHKTLQILLLTALLVHLKVHPALPHQPQAHLLPKSVRKMLLRLQLQLKRVNLTH